MSEKEGRRKKITGAKSASKETQPQLAQERLVYPVQKREVIILLEKYHKIPTTLYRKITDPGEVSPISLDKAGLPKMKTDFLPSHAYQVGGWKLVREIIKTEESLENLRWGSDNERYASTLQWTSTDITWAGAYQSPDDVPSVLSVITPNLNRTRLEIFDGKDYTDEKSDEEYRKLLESIQHNIPFIIVEPAIPGMENETLLGPYIHKSEVPALIRIDPAYSSEFNALITEIHQS